MRSFATKVGMGMVVTFWLVQLLYATCIFGPQNADLLKMRNQSIMTLMNSTLISATNTANNTMGKIQTLPLWSYLQRTYAVSPVNYLQFVSMGKLYSIDWAKVVSTLLLTDLTLASSLKYDYVIPVHEKLQRIASNYSFYLGIFRPKQMQFNFTGITAISNATSTYFVLDTSCMAGSYFLWQMTLDLSYTASFNNSYAYSTAVLATMIENAFDNHYRKNTSALNTEFIRANFIRASSSTGGQTTILLEMYFQSSSIQNETITNLTSISKFPIMTFSDETRNASVTIIPSSGSTFITNALYLVTRETASTSTVLTSTMSSSTSTVKETIATSAFPDSSTSASLIITDGISSTRKTASTSDIMSISDSTTVTGTLLDTTVNINVSIASTPMGTTAAAISTSELPGITSTVVGSTLVISESIPAVTSNTAATPGITSKILGTTIGTESPQPMSESTLAVTETTLAGNTSSTGAQVTITKSSTFPNGSLTRQHVSTASTDMTVILNISTSTLSASEQQTTRDQYATIASKTSLVPLNASSTVAAVSTGTSNKTIANGSEILDTQGTFDPDPFFKAHVPVVTKVYNDHYLLKFRFGTMAPITEKLTFYTITLPAAIGMTAGAIFCMICWQMDCRKNRK